MVVKIMEKNLRFSSYDKKLIWGISIYIFGFYLCNLENIILYVNM